MQTMFFFMGFAVVCMTKKKLHHEGDDEQEIESYSEKDHIILCLI